MSQISKCFILLSLKGTCQGRSSGGAGKNFPQGEMDLGPLKKQQIFPCISAKAALWRRAGASPAISTAGGCSACFFQRSHLVKKQFFHYKLDGKPGRLTQRKSAILTRWKSQVQILHRLPVNSGGYGSKPQPLSIPDSFCCPSLEKACRVFYSLTHSKNLAGPYCQKTILPLFRRRLWRLGRALFPGIAL